MDEIGEVAAYTRRKMTDGGKQNLLDEEHLKLLRIGYIIAGAADAVFALFPLIYVIMGFFIAVGAGTSDEPEAAVFGAIFMVVGMVMSLLFGLQAGLKLYTARALGKREHRTLCFVAAALSCLQMPWGTALGVFTFMVLARTSVRDLFETHTAQLGAPHERVRSTLFDDDEALRW